MITVYKTGAELIAAHKGILDSNPLESGFWYMDAAMIANADKRDYVIAVTEDGKTLLSIRPYPYNMMLMGDETLVGELIDFLLWEEYELDSVLCNERIGDAFCEYMSREKHIEYYEALAMDYMESGSVYAPTDSEVGKADANDVRELTALMDLFAEECGLEERSSEEEITRKLEQFRVIRRDGRIAAMATLSSDTDRAKRVSAVYTRPEYRGQNLACKVVNAVKNEILESGFIADLNVDQRNPVTNYLYRKLGFERIFAQGQYRRALVETERLSLYPLSDAEMEALIEKESDAELKQAYTEMLDACVVAPRDRVFSAVWVLKRREDGAIVGDLSFKGLGDDGAVEIGYGTYEPYRNRGYMTEAVKAMTRWALEQGCVKRVEAEVVESNAASKRVLEKAFFVPKGIIGEEGPRYVFNGEGEN